LKLACSSCAGSQLLNLQVKPGSCSVQGLLYEGHAILPQEKSKADLLSPAVAAAMLHIILFFQQQLQKKQKISIGCPTAHL
jgi:Ca2+/Na+ antiporter